MGNEQYATLLYLLYAIDIEWIWIWIWILMDMDMDGSYVSPDIISTLDGNEMGWERDGMGWDRKKKIKRG
jgi:hypothetical protein